ncbi:helix-turn-helix domain-containing protein [Flavobacterium sp. ST-87]|uniref:Helix-turn-helix domain-containing protein n=1 Tax=Flavobacterium plantiphilum TaxID=3163297 RepID=A0ABW8XQG9_9FLAO
MRMLRTLLHIDLDQLPVRGFDIQILKDCRFKKGGEDWFVAINTAVLVIKEGSVSIENKDSICELYAKDLLVLSKFNAYRIVSITHPLHLFYVSFTPDFVLRHCHKSELVDAFYFFIGKNQQKVSLNTKSFLILSLICKLLYQLYSDNDSHLTPGSLKQISFHLFLSELRNIYGQFAADYHLNFSRNEYLTVRFLSLVALHFQQQHHISFYSSALYVTAGHLNKVVKAVTGKNVKKLLAYALVTEAKTALGDGDKTIVEIGESLGFSSASAFSVFFKKHTGLSPNQYRKQLC